MKKDLVVLLNMGGPNNLNEVEMFLKNMFADKNILTMKSNLLRKIVGGLIVFNRTESSQEIYRKLGGKSPIVKHTKKLVSKLQDRFGNDVIVDFAMRYTPPFADEVLEKVSQKDIDKIYLIPLYPQYSTTTTKSSLEDFRELYLKSKKKYDIVENIEFFKNKTYNRAIIDKIKESMQDSLYSDFDIIFSAHGLPKKIVEAGDPYERHINNHIEILKEIMSQENMNFNNIHLAYQSKVGPMEWLSPSLEDKLKTIENKRVIIFPIAFTIDNSETDFELAIEYKEIADSLGFESYKVSSCPNDSDIFVDALIEIYDSMKS